MITKVQSFQTSDNSVWPTMEAAQLHEMTVFLTGIGIDEENVAGPIAVKLLEKKDHVIDILTMKASSKPKARKVNGGTKTRTRAANANPTNPNPPTNFKPV